MTCILCICPLSKCPPSPWSMFTLMKNSKNYSGKSFYLPLTLNIYIEIKSNIKKKQFWNLEHWQLSSPSAILWGGGMACPFGHRRCRNEAEARETTLRSHTWGMTITHEASPELMTKRWNKVPSDWTLNDTFGGSVGIFKYQILM